MLASESDDAFLAIDLGVQLFRRHQLGQKVFCCVGIQTEQFRETGTGDSVVVFGNGADVLRRDKESH